MIIITQGNTKADTFSETAVLQAQGLDCALKDGLSRVIILSVGDGHGEGMPCLVFIYL